MSKKPLVHCRICKKAIDRDTEIEGIDWIMPSKNYYYHKQCYEDWAKIKDNIHSSANDDMWFEAMWGYLRKELKMSLNYNKLKNQWKSFLKKGYTAKGIYFCLKYFYEVKKGDPEKSEGGIGIIPYIYEDGAKYWLEREHSDKGICMRIEEQIKQAQQQETIKIKVKKQNTQKRINLLDVLDMEETIG